MTVTTTTNYKEYQADGIAKTYSIPFLLLDRSDLLVYLDNQLITSGYTITGLGNPISQIVFNDAPLGILLLQRSITLLRETDYQENGDLLAKTVNQDFDRIYLALQGTSQDNTKALRVSDTNGINPLPFANDRASKLLGFDTQGQPLLVTSNSGTAIQLAQDLADSTSQTKGAGMIGYSKNISYPTATTGYALNSLFKFNSELPVITGSTQMPNDSQGKDGDIWLVYEAIQ